MQRIIDKVNLFRGFHPDKNGKTEIMINRGHATLEERVRGDWVYGGITFDKAGNYYIAPERFSDYNEELHVLTETVGKWVRPDMDGKDIFVGDRLVDLCGDICTVVINIDTFEYGVVHDLFPKRFKNFHSIQSYTKAGNIFEVK